MNLTQKLLAFTLVGAEWVLWLLIILSVLSVAVMIERALYFYRLRTDFGGLADDVKRLILADKLEDARKRVHETEGPLATVLVAGLDEAERGVEAAESAMLGARATARLRLERNLAFLGTLGSNAPFIGLFGTVLGIIKAFHDLAANSAGGITVVMTGISEALVATAVGLLVAIPAVVGFNFFNRRVRSISSYIDALAQAILVALRTYEHHQATAAATASAPTGKPGKKDADKESR